MANVSTEIESPVHEYMDAAEMILLEAEFEPFRDRYWISAHAMDEFRDWHAHITGRRIPRTTP